MRLGAWHRLAVAMALSGKRVAFMTMDAERARRAIQEVLDEDGLPWPETLDIVELGGDHSAGRPPALDKRH